MNVATAISQSLITPMFFPSGDRRLMGVHYAPSPQASRGHGVVMCNQVGPDYANYYKTGRMLVGMLVAKGFDCLRFDYTGCGDSEGSFEDGSVRQWLLDIESAVALLKQLSPCARVSLCGFGFGALLAATHAANCQVDSLVLWEPVVDGRAYCRALRKNHKLWLRGSFVKATSEDGDFQAMGFPATADLERQMSELGLGGLTSQATTRVFAALPEGSPDKAAIERHFGGHDAGARMCAVPHGSLPLVPMRAMAAWLEGAAAND